LDGGARGANHSAINDDENGKIDDQYGEGNGELSVRCIPLFLEIFFHLRVIELEAQQIDLGVKDARVLVLGIKEVDFQRLGVNAPIIAHNHHD